MKWMVAAYTLVVSLGSVMVADADHHKQNEGNTAGDWIKLDDPKHWMEHEGWEFDGNAIALRESGGGYIWTQEKYEDFVLDLEFKMSENCNSGVFFRTDPSNAVQAGFEVQVFDSHGKENVGNHDCGALYDVVAPKKNVTKDAGEWNHLRLTCDGPNITAWMNGTTLWEIDISQWTEGNRNPDGSRNKFNNPLAELSRNNHIGFQDHGHPVTYRNVKIKRLE